MNTPKQKSQPPFILAKKNEGKLPLPGSITAIIADDEPNIAHHLRQMLSEVAPEIQIAAIVHDGEATLRAVAEHDPALVFLDIRMPGLDGVEVAWRCQNHTNIIFVTAYQQHAATAFEQGAIDYILKPITPERLGQAIFRFYERMRKATDGKQYITLLRASANNGQAVYLIPENEILFLEAMGNYCLVHAAGGEQGTLRYPITQLKEHLNPEHFIQIHRGWVVNRRRIQRIVRQGHGAMLQMRGSAKELRVSRQYMHGLVSDMML